MIDNDMKDVDVFVGARIRAQRIALGMSQTDLGNAIGVRFQQVQKYEAGVNRVSASRLWAIADVLGVEISYFFDGIDAVTGQRHGDDPSAAITNDPQTLEAARLFHALSDRHKAAVLAFLRSLAGASGDEDR